MGTTADKLQAALDSKEAVQTALEEKGLDVTDDFSTYASLISDELENTSDATADESMILEGAVAYTATGRTTGTYVPSGDNTAYDNTNSGLEATNVQDAIDEIADDIENHTHLYAGSDTKGGPANTAVKLQTARNVNGMSFDGSADRANYGTCSTAAATAAKTVACTGFELVTGAEITVKFTANNTASSPTLNVNGTGAKPIYYRDAAITAGYLAMNRTYTFRYNGTQWEFVGDINTDTKYSAATTSTSGLMSATDKSNLENHIASKSNPHGVTALQATYDNSASGLSSATAQGAIDELSSILSNLFTYSATSNGIGGQTSFAIGDFAIVVGRKEVATNASGAMDLDVELPYDFITATLCDNAYSMYYMDAESTDNYYASIVHSEVIHNKIFGHLCYHYQSSYCLYTYVVAGKISLS